MKKSWKTFSAGIAAVVGGVAALWFAYKSGNLNEATVTGSATSILTGVGLIFARDNNVSSVDVGIQGVTTNMRGEAVVTPVGPDASQELKDKIKIEHGL